MYFSTEGNIDKMLGIAYVFKYKASADNMQSIDDYMLMMVSKILSRKPWGMYQLQRIERQLETSIVSPIFATPCKFIKKQSKEKGMFRTI